MMPRCLLGRLLVASSAPTHSCSSEGVLSPAPGAHNFSGSRLQQCAERAVDDSFRQHLLSSSFGVAPQVRNLPVHSFTGTLECGFPATYRGHISRKFHHETPQQLLYHPVSHSHALFNRVWTSVLWAGRRRSSFQLEG